MLFAQIDLCPEMKIRQSGQDVGQEEMSQARVPDSVLQFGSYPNATGRQAGRKAGRQNFAAPNLEECYSKDGDSPKNWTQKRKLKVFWELV